MKNISKVINSTSRGLNTIRQVAMDVISSISGTGKTANTKTYNGAELRELRIMLPYGISSSALDNLLAQVIINNDKNNAMVGVYDPSRPNVEAGELILYSNFECTIKMLKNGSIVITSKDGHSITMNSTEMNITSSKDLKINVTGDLAITCNSFTVNGVPYGV